MNDGLAFFTGCALTLITCVGIIVGITDHIDAKWKKDAVKHGHAEFVVDEFGDVKWQWKQ